MPAPTRQSLADAPSLWNASYKHQANEAGLLLHMARSPLILDLYESFRGHTQVAARFQMERDRREDVVQEAVQRLLDARDWPTHGCAGTAGRWADMANNAIVVVVGVCHDQRPPVVVHYDWLGGSRRDLHLTPITDWLAPVDLPGTKRHVTVPAHTPLVLEHD
jgi:hypothetical protein